jgi:trigger factor
VKVSTERIENSQIVLEVEADPDELERSMEGAYHSLVNRAEVPGFRRGKAPREMLERHIGREALLGEALDRLIPQLLSQAIEDQGIEAIARPDIEITQTDPVTFKATVSLLPTVELGNYHEISIAPEPVEVAEEEVNKVFDQLRYQHAIWEPVERPVKSGDLVTIDVTGNVEENTLLDRKDLQFQVLQGLPFPVPGFAENIEGLEKDQDKEFSISLPADYEVSELAGKECLFKVRVSEIKEIKLPELNDEFVISIGQGFETLDALTENITSNLHTMSEEGSRRRHEEKIINTLAEISRVEFPPVLVEREIDRLIAAHERELSQNKMSLEDYLKSREKSKEELREELRPMAIRQVTGSLVLSKVTEAEEITVAEKEIDEEVEEMVKGAGEQEEEARKILQNKATRKSLENVLITRKTIKRLVEIASGREEATAETGTAESTSSEDEATAETATAKSTSGEDEATAETATAESTSGEDEATAEKG